MPLVSVVSLNYHGNCGSTIGRRNETLSLGNRESHNIPENDREEVCDGIGVGGCEHVESGEGPDLAVISISEIITENKWFCLDICAIVLNPCDDESSFAVIEEMP